jgi:nucleotide-binding universal stress UspA family protein
MYVIVVGVDGSDNSFRALAVAAGMARRMDAQLFACFVMHVPAVAELGAFALPIAPPRLEAVDFSGLSAEVEKELAEAGVKGQFVCREGEVARELEALAESLKADMIIVGRSRHPALHVGAAPRRLLSMGRRPVVVVP